MQKVREIIDIFLKHIKGNANLVQRVKLPFSALEEESAVCVLRALDGEHTRAILKTLRVSCTGLRTLRVDVNHNKLATVMDLGMARLKGAVDLISKELSNFEPRSIFSVNIESSPCRCQLSCRGMRLEPHERFRDGSQRKKEASVNKMRIYGWTVLVDL